MRGNIMDNLEQYKASYQFIIDYFKEERIVKRYEWLYDQMEDYISSSKLTNRVYISEDILNHVIIDYFVDIYRLKDFQDIEIVHDSKIYAYLANWILRHKPIQIMPDDAEKEAFKNEKFVTELLRCYLFSNPADVTISNCKKEDVDNFLETLLYYFKYRDYSAKNIEILILAFVAGRGYQYSVDYTK